MGRIMHLTYSSNLSDLCERNSSFDSGVLRVAYTDRNRNGSFISKEAYERSIHTIYNVPIVCNYNREDDSIGGHDAELVHDEDGLRMVNVTQPVGVIPESAKYYWETVQEDNGETHEYLCVDALLWKRQEAYRKIKEDGITAESMEITVNNGRFNKEMGLYVIDDFEFTAFCLLGDGVEPCFEQAGLEVFSLGEFKEQMNEMMAELKETFTLLNTPNNEVDIEKESFTKGGNEKLEEKLALMEKYGLKAEDLDFSIDDFSAEELQEKFEAMKQTANFDDGGGDTDPDPSDGEGGEGGTSDPDPGTGEGGGEEGGGTTDPGSGEGSGSGSGDGEPEEADGDDDLPDNIRRDPTHTDKYELNSQICSGIYEAMLECETVEMPWGQEPRYCMADFDMEKGEVYAYDCTDWHVYGFGYSMNGDHVVINWSSKKRMKCAYVDYDEGAEVPEAFSHFGEKYQEKINELNRFKLNVEEKEAQARRDEVIAEFSDLNGVEAFEALKENNAGYTAETLEEKCFALRGRTVKFSAEQKAPKIKVEQTNVSDDANEPYGGLFVKYGIVGK